MLNRNPKRAKRILKRHFKEDLFSLSAVQYILHLDIDTEITHRPTKTLCPCFLIWRIFVREVPTTSPDKLVVDVVKTYPATAGSYF